MGCLLSVSSVSIKVPSKAGTSEIADVGDFQLRRVVLHSLVIFINIYDS